MAEREDGQEQGVDLAADFDLATFLAWRAPRLGSANPSRMDNPVWQWLVRTRASAFRANEHMDGPASDEAGPCWSFQRFGQTKLTLADGTLLYIGGEHEDHYDPDFYIYNDVVMIGPDGAVRIYGYRAQDFAPTDFHSATLADGQVVIIGGLGYPQQRDYACTAVYRLSLDTLAISRVDLPGAGPGAIARHTARLSDDGASIIVSGGEVLAGPTLYARHNRDEWRLDLATWQWDCSRRWPWRQCVLAPLERKPSLLFAFAHASWEQQGWNGAGGGALAGLTAVLGMAPDLVLYRQRYLMDGCATTLARHDDDAYNVFRVVVEATELRFTEGGGAVNVVVDGPLTAERFDAMMAGVAATLGRLLGRPWGVQWTR